MLSLFKKKFYLPEVMPTGYIDIHNHILPSIDDGSQNIEDTHALIKGMKELKIANAIATPHTFNGLWNNTPTSIKTAYEIATESTVNKSFIKGYASEYMLDISLLERIKKEPLLCIYENYVLIEFSFSMKPLNLFEMLFEIKNKGYKIIIAHPERYIYFHNSIEKFEKLKNSGVYFQLNLLSLIGFYGKEVLKTAELLLENDLYDFTGSDIHNEGQINRLKSKPILISNKNKIADLLKNHDLFRK